MMPISEFGDPTDTARLASFVSNAATADDRRKYEIMAEELEAKRKFDQLNEHMHRLEIEQRLVTEARDAIAVNLLQRRTMDRVGAVLGVSRSRIHQMKRRFLKGN